MKQAAMLAGAIALLASSDAVAWLKSERESRVDGTKRVAIERFAPEEYRDGSGGRTRPEITIECRAGRSMVWIAFNRVMSCGDGQSIAYKVDEQPPRRIWMFSATSCKAFGLDGGNAISFSQQLIGRKLLHLRATPHGEGPSEITFDVSDLDNAIKPIADLCKWAKPAPAAAPRKESSAPPSPAKRPDDFNAVAGSIAAGRTAPLTAAEIAAVHAQLRPCWNMDAAAHAPQALIVTLELDMNPDGTVRAAQVSDRPRMAQDGAFRAAAEAALRAAHNPRCTPLKLPADRYERWRKLILVMDPRRS